MWRSGEEREGREDSPLELVLTAGCPEQDLLGSQAQGIHPRSRLSGGEGAGGSILCQSLDRALLFGREMALTVLLDQCLESRRSPACLLHRKGRLLLCQGPTQVDRAMRSSTRKR